MTSLLYKYVSVPSNTLSNASSTSAAASAAASPIQLLAPETLQHPGLLQTAADFEWIRASLAAGKQPWMQAWQQILDCEYASPAYEPRPAPTIYRGSDGLYEDVVAVYVLALCYQISQNTTYGDAAAGYERVVVDARGVGAATCLDSSEYIARYNLFYHVPYTYDHWPIALPTIGDGSRGDIRRNWELLYNHYGVLNGQNVTWTKRFRDMEVNTTGGVKAGSG
ncbi:hypothetical protein SCUCBS95973_003692 [Sporothrix curviconia]|uniref:Uncharacterized protein n=1 Tax=Sporothrix curviconia TaxID=1260050 RepID=A0ABP0BHQ1_9PEZI